ncbi:MAG: hypothetical protein R3B91_05650 [Planctomycetaceae bacterium]
MSLAVLAGILGSVFTLFWTEGVLHHANVAQAQPAAGPRCLTRLNPIFLQLTYPQD